MTGKIKTYYTPLINYNYYITPAQYFSKDTNKNLENVKHSFHPRLKSKD